MVAAILPLALVACGAIAAQMVPGHGPAVFAQNVILGDHTGVEKVAGPFSLLAGDAYVIVLRPYFTNVHEAPLETVIAWRLLDAVGAEQQSGVHAFDFQRKNPNRVGPLRIAVVAASSSEHVLSVSSDSPGEHPEVLTYVYQTSSLRGALIVGTLALAMVYGIGAGVVVRRRSARG